MKLVVWIMLMRFVAMGTTKRRDPDYYDSNSDEYDSYEEYDYEYYSDSYYYDSYDSMSCGTLEAEISPLKLAYDKKCGPQFACVVPEGGLIIRRDKKFNNNDGYFDRSFQEYVNGFGSCNQEFFIGLAELHKITSQGKWVLTVELGDGTGAKYTVKYHQFWVGPAPEYRLNVGGFQEISPGMGDSLISLNNMPFTTKDRDLDLYRNNCAELYKGGWWFKVCFDNGANFISPFRGQHNYGVSWLTRSGAKSAKSQLPEGAWYLNKA